MAQWTVTINARMKISGRCIVSVATSQKDRDGRALYREVVLVDGETVRTDDPVTARELNVLTLGETPILTPLPSRPVSPTHDVDRVEGAPLPVRTPSSEIVRVR